MEQTLERVQAIKAEMKDIENRINDHSLTLAELEALDDEWEVLDAELEMYDDILYSQQVAEQAELELAKPEDEEEEDFTNPPEWLVERWESERDFICGNNIYEYLFDLADEV